MHGKPEGDRLSEVIDDPLQFVKAEVVEVDVVDLQRGRLFIPVLLDVILRTGGDLNAFALEDELRRRVRVDLYNPHGLLSLGYGQRHRLRRQL